jgi:metal-sulfur cluster biosynthetic enzyme
MTGPGAGDARALRSAVERALGRIEDPCSVALDAGWTVRDLGLLVDVRGDDGGILVEITLTDPFCPFYASLEHLITEAVEEETGSPTRVEVSGDVAWHPGLAKRGLLASRDQPALKAVHYVQPGCT